MCVVDFCKHNLHIFMQVPIGGDAGIPRIDASAVVDKIVGQRKDELDRSFTRWVLKSCRPLGIGENDKALRDFIQVSCHSP